MSRASQSLVPAPLRRLRAWALRRIGGEGGFILLESIIAISLITVIMGAVGAEYVAGLSSASHQRAEKTAIQLADSAMEQIRALHASDLLTGRDQSSVIAERNTLTAYPTVGSVVSSDATKLAYDKSVTSGGASAAVPTCNVGAGGTCASTPALIQQPGTTAFTVYKYLECDSAGDQGSCLSTGSTTNYVRVIVAVTWTQRGCPSSQCAYTTSTLINADADPQFNSNQPLPPAPQIAPIAAQSIEVDENVSLQLLAKDGTGVAPFFWSEPTTAPTGMAKLSTLGLVISPGGLISGKVIPGAVSGTQTQIILTDSFGSRTDTATITWTVYPKLNFTAVANQVNFTSDAVNVTVAASGGKSGYTFSDPDDTLPDGLSISSAGKITGSPTAAGVTSVHLLVSDGTNPPHTATSNTFTWTVTNPPVGATNPGTQVSTLSKAITTLTLRASGGTPGYTWTSTGLPTGLTLSGSTITGTPSALGTYSTTVKVTDSAGTTATQAFTWKVVAAPTITAPAAQTSTVGGSISTALTYTCPNSPCTFVLKNSPTGPTATGGTISGTVGGTAGSYSTAAVTITDAAGASVTSSPFTWTVNAAPALASPGNQTTAPGTLVSLDMSTRLTGGTSSYTYAVASGSALPAGLTISATTGVISGRTGTTNVKTSNVKITVTDARGVSATTAAFLWNVSNISLDVGDYSIPLNTTVNVSLASFTTGGTGSYTYTASNLPTGLSLSSGSVVGKVTARGTWNATITVTDSNGAVDVDATKIVVT